MSQSAPELRSFRQVFRRYGILIGAAVAASLLAGVVTAAFSPAMVTSTALVALPLSSLTSTAAVAIADSDPVLVGALPRLSPGTSLGTVHGEVQVRSLTPYVLSISARAGTAAQAEATANAVAESYMGYAGSAGRPGRAHASDNAPAGDERERGGVAHPAAGRRDARRGIRGTDRSHRGASEPAADLHPLSSPREIWPLAGSGRRTPIAARSRAADRFPRTPCGLTPSRKMSSSMLSAGLQCYR